MRDRVLTGARALLQILRVLNWIAGAALLGMIAFSFLGHDMLAASLVRKYGAALNVEAVIVAMRLVVGLGVAIAVPVHVIFTALLRILASVEQGDPFVATNAKLLQGIGWALLFIQLGDLAYGASVLWFSSLGLEGNGWNPSVGGWISVLMVFVLARVFAIGSRMRDELAMTV